MYTPPVIIMGSHRSGTTMMVRLLEGLGFFAGARQGPNSEAFFYLFRNEWLMRRAGGAWDYPLPVKTLLSVREYREEALGMMLKAVRSAEFQEYTGRWLDLLPGADRKMRGPWGWKDPRNVFTLPLWARVYPGARLLYIKRNGVDVAQSLRAREVDSKGEPLAPCHVLALRGLPGKLLGLLRPVERYCLKSLRCATLEGAFALWAEYTAEAEAAFTAFEGPKLALRYEDMLAEPEEWLARTSAFCGLQATPEEVRRAASTVNITRSCAFASKPSLVEFYGKVREHPLMKGLGYGEICKP